MDTLCEARDVHAHYGESHVLRGVSLTVQPGEAIGLLGRNGMGKTTLIRTLLGHVRASRGSLHVRGRDTTRERPDRIARMGIGYVPEGRQIFPNLTVRENLELAARSGVRGQREWTLARVLETFPRLAERLGHGGGQLSGGEQQMLAVGRALIGNPDLVVLDEATEGLAPQIVAEIWRIIAAVRATGIASLIVDRNYRSVLAHTDRALVMEKGKLVLEGTSADLLGDPAALGRLLGV
jgi:branched-chain amino acid transport system ATP-binding protein